MQPEGDREANTEDENSLLCLITHGIFNSKTLP